MCNKLDRRGVAKILLALLCVSIPSVVAAQTSTAEPQSNSPLQSVSNFSDVYSGKHFHVANTILNSTAMSNNIGISAEVNGVPGTQSFSLSLPRGADRSTLKAKLNGHDISGRFSGESGFVTAADGLNTVKNVLSVTVKTSSGGMASGHWRSMVGIPHSNVRRSPSPSAVAPKAAGVASPRAAASVVSSEPDVPINAVCDPVAMCPAWLPPSVRFDTVAKGNWNGSTPWIVVNGVPSNGSTSVSAQYVLAVYNRQTLEQEDFEWFTNGGGAGVTNFIKGKNYTSNDLVIVGTGPATSAIDSGLDMSSIGGTNWGSLSSSYQLPSSYMIVGAGGLPAQAAYENYGPAGAYATGSLMEDSNGNYNFQSSDIIEYAVEPQDPGNFSNPTIRMNVPANLSVNGETQIEFLANALAGQNGIWMLVLDRENPMPPYNKTGSDCIDYESANGTRVMQNCGTFFAVGAGNSNIDAQWSALGAALNATPSSKFVFLQSIGSVGSNSQAETVTNGSWSGNRTFTGYRTFADAFQAFGGTPYAVAGPTYTNQDNYAFLGYKGGGNALTGAVAELSTAFPGQMGVLHGTLQRNSNGYYQPAQNSAEQQGLFNAKGGISDSDYLLSVASFQQPVEWPSNSGTTLLPGASSLAGQQAAFRFISHWLLAGYYLKTIQGPHQDDIHFFFTGSVNTSIDYHTMDPANLQFPVAGTWASFGCTTSDGSTCTFQAPGDSATSSFTSADFNAVKGQVSLEVTYLTNTLQFLVTGSTNLKDVVASGNANVGLALSAAANTIQGSGMANLNAQEIASKQVTFSWQSLLGTIGGFVSIAANLEGAGEALQLFDVTKGIWKAAKSGVAIANTVGAVISTAGSIGSIGSASTNTSFLQASPQPFARLTTTIGELATQDLQSPLLTGFDSTVDNITADWGRLSTIGPRTTDTTDSTFFAPNQVQQITTINALTSSSARSFYSALLPTVYNLHYWSGVSWVGSGNGFSQPTVGSIQSHDEYDSCNAFYLSPNTVNSNGSGLGQLSQYQSIAYYSAGGTGHPFGQDEGYFDFWVMDSVASKAGTQNVNIGVIDTDLANNLFASDQLNIPMYQMFSANGPMAGVTYDASVSNPSGWSNDNICDASDANSWTDTDAGVLTGRPTSGKLLTTTSFISQPSGVLGKDAIFTFQVMAGKQPVTSGSVYISIDGAVAGNPSIGANGSASWTASGGLTLGEHQIQADYAPGSGYEGSTSQTSKFVVYSESADIGITMASTSVNASYTAASTPVAIQINSIAGLAGDVVLSCTGLPAGLACTFNSQSLKLAADGSVNATVQIGPSQTTQTSKALLLLPLLGLGCCFGADRRFAKRLLIAFIATGLFATTLTGCSGGTTLPTTTRETGIKTITVNARVGTVSRSVGVDVNVQ